MYTPKSRQEYIDSCLFYNTNDSYKSKIISQLANYERCWVDWHYTDEGLKFLRTNLQEYKSFGLGHFRKDDGLPITLKAIYWNRWYNKGVEGMGTADDFKDIYRNFFIRTYYISKCRYYTGSDDYETISTELNNDKMFAFYEKHWVEQSLDNKKVKEDEIHAWLLEGDILWLRNFNTNDGVPLSIKALLWNRYEHWLGGYSEHDVEIDNFKKWYKKEYLKE